MKYISRILSWRDGVVPGFMFSGSSIQEYVVATVYDTETGAEKDMSPFDLGGDILGYAWEALVSNDAKTVQIHKYIESVVVEKGGNNQWAMTDTCILNVGGRPNHILADGRIRLTVELGAAKVRVLGVDNSVWIRENGTGTFLTIYNMYNLLASLCRDCELNLMKYSTIRLYTRDGLETSMTTINLKHNLEADRFFTKMWLDVSKK